MKCVWKIFTRINRALQRLQFQLCCNLWGNCNPLLLAAYPPPDCPPPQILPKRLALPLPISPEPQVQKGHPLHWTAGRQRSLWKRMGIPPPIHRLGPNPRKSNKSHVCNQAETDQPSVTAPKLGSGGAVLHPMKSILTRLFAGHLLRAVPEKVRAPVLPLSCLYLGRVLQLLIPASLGSQPTNLHAMCKGSSFR